MKTYTTQDIIKISNEFLIEGTPDIIEECHFGHINGTFFLTVNGTGKKYVLQKINTSIFTNYKGLMNNISRVTDFLRDKYTKMGYADSYRRTLNIVKTKQGDLYYEDQWESIWRVYDFISDAVCYQAVESADMFKKVGEAFGKFQKDLSDFDASVLCETIPNFHNTVSRLNDLYAAVEKDPLKRTKELSAELNFVKEHAALCSYVVDRIKTNVFPLRVTHNDTKLNNIMIDNKTGEGICVIDLDTIMPGSVLYDFGDSIRFGASSAAEDEKDLDLVYMRLEMFEAFADGFVNSLGGALTKDEILSLPMGAIIITLETGIRFLTDYINGDTYFKIEYANHNLNRARNQFKLVSDMETKLEKMISIVKKYI